MELFAGTTLSYLTFFGNLEAGCRLVDNHDQLRIVMFLYHGLLLNGIIDGGQIPFLDILYALFKNSRAVWEGALPCRGELVQRFWTSLGLDRVNSKRMAEEARRMHGSNGLDGRRAQNADFDRRRLRMNPIKPEEISKSYRRICNNDFHDVVDKYPTTGQRGGRQDSDNYAFVAQVNETLDVINKEQQLLSFNLMSCGVVLEQCDVSWFESCSGIH